MPQVMQFGDEYLLVSQQTTYQPKAKLKGGPRKVFFVKYNDSKYKLASGRNKKYSYPCVGIGGASFHCPKELAGKYVRFVVEVAEPQKKNQSQRSY